MRFADVGQATEFLDDFALKISALVAMKLFWKTIVVDELMKKNIRSGSSRLISARNSNGILGEVICHNKNVFYSTFGGL